MCTGHTAECPNELRNAPSVEDGPNKEDHRLRARRLWAGPRRGSAMWNDVNALARNAEALHHLPARELGNRENCARLSSGATRQPPASNALPRPEPFPLVDRPFAQQTSEVAAYAGWMSAQLAGIDADPHPRLLCARRSTAS